MFFTFPYRSPWATTKLELAKKDLLVFYCANDSCLERKNVWSTSRTEPSTMPTRASPTSHALSVTSCIMWESHLILFLLPLGTSLMPSRTAWWENSKGFWIRGAMNRHEEGKRKFNEVILPAVWAHTVHLDEDFISPECISLTLCASVNLAQVHGSPKHITSLSGFGKSQLKHGGGRRRRKKSIFSCHGTFHITKLL